MCCLKHLGSIPLLFTIVIYPWQVQMDIFSCHYPKKNTLTFPNVKQKNGHFVAGSWFSSLSSRALAPYLHGQLWSIASFYQCRGREGRGWRGKTNECPFKEEPLYPKFANHWFSGDI